MLEREIGELRRRLRMDKCAIFLRMCSLEDRDAS